MRVLERASVPCYGFWIFFGHWEIAEMGQTIRDASLELERPAASWRSAASPTRRNSTAACSSTTART